MSTSPASIATDAPVLSARKRAFFKLVIAAFLIAIVSGVLFAAEWAARSRERSRTRPPDFFPTMFYPHLRVRYGLIPGLDYYGWFRINSLGFRGREIAKEKPAGTFRILCLGGSTTFDVGSVGPSQPWPAIVEAELSRLLPGTPIEVLNLGIPGGTSTDNLIDLQIRGLSLQPDMVIVYQGHNDFRYSILAPTMETTPPDLYPLEQPTRNGIERWLQQHSLLYAKSRGRITDFTAGVLAKIWSAPQRPVTESERAAKLAEGLAEFKSNIVSIDAILRARGIRLVLPEVMFPDPAAQPADGTCRICEGMSGSFRGIPATAIVDSYRAYNLVLDQVGAASETADYLRTGWVPSSDRFYQDAVHFNPQGSKLMGQHLAQALHPIIASMLAPRGSAESTPAPGLRP